MKGDGTSLSPRLQRLVGWNSNCSPRAASKLAQKTGSDIDAAYPRLRREFRRLRADLRYGDREVPGRRKGAERAEGGEDDGRRRRDVEVPSGPGSRSNHPKGLARVALKALAHRLRTEDSPPEGETGHNR